jgi:hypothetical protein
MTVLADMDTKFLPPGYAIGISPWYKTFTFTPSTFTQYEQIELSKGDFMLFFFDLDSLQKQISQTLSLRTMKQMFKSFSHEFATSLNCI